MAKSVLSNLEDARLLFVDDDPLILEILKARMAEYACHLFTASNGEDALALMRKTPIDIIVSDMSMPGLSGQELLQQVADKYPETIRLVLSGCSEIDTILSAVNQGRVWGYLEKPWDNDQLIVVLEQAIFTQKALAERSLLRRTLAHYEKHQKSHFHGFYGDSTAMQCVYRALENCGPSNASVFITGESGTGKEVAATAIHNLSRRRERPLIVLNCAAIPGELMESEIFGHVKGAFTGAVSHRSGAASLADGGTLFLDEICEMDIGLQAKLLRFIQTGCFQRVGSDRVEKVDIRFVCATNRDPAAAIADKSFREDLFYRLNVISLHLPELNAREGDVLMLAYIFLKTFSEQEGKKFIGIESDAEKVIRGYSWRGNVRQLQACIHSGVIRSNGPLLTLETLAEVLNIPIQAKTVAEVSELNVRVESEAVVVRPLALVEREAIEHAIDVCGGNVVEAAGALGVSPSTLYRKMQIWQPEI